MNAQEVRLAEQVFLRHQRGAAGLGGLRGEVLAPCDQRHAERLADLAHFGAELAEAEQAERLAAKLDAERRLPRHTGLHAVVLVADLARGPDHEADRKLLLPLSRGPEPRQRGPRSSRYGA